MAFKLAGNGFFAKDLTHCLWLQFTPTEQQNPKLSTLMANLELLSKGQWAQLARRCQLDLNELKALLNRLKTFNPDPVSNLKSNVSPAVTPDLVTSVNEHGEWQITLYQKFLPQITLNNDLFNRVKSKMPVNSQDRKYSLNQYNQAKQVTNAINQRQLSLLKVAKIMVEQQRDFLLHGPNYQVPLNLEQIANVVNLHISTISRIIGNKYMLTPRGVMPLKALLCQASGGIAGMATSSIKFQLTELVKNEPDQCYSDEELATKLKELGIAISRRTVTKYREQLSIGSKAERRRLKAVALA